MACQFRLPYMLLSFAICFLTRIGYGQHDLPVDHDDTKLEIGFAEHVLPLLASFCLDCHSAPDAEANIALDHIHSVHDVRGAGKTWLRALDAVVAGTMPPPDSPQPSLEMRSQLRDWSESVWAPSRQAIPLASVTMRRLNRNEYDNTIRDLIGLDLKIAQSFPPDDMAFGFDNIGSALKLSPAHLERYLDAAEAVLKSAIWVPDVVQRPPVELIGLRTYPLAPDDKVVFEHHLSEGRYMVEFSLVRVGIDEAEPPPRLLIGFGKDSRTLNAVQIQDETIVYRFWINVAEGDHEVEVSVAPQLVEPQVVARSVGTNVSGDQRYGNNRGLHVDSMVVRGPIPFDRSIETGPVETAHLPESHRKILYCQPQFGDENRISCGQEVITRFAERAFRGPINQVDIASALRVFQMAHAHGESFERAVQLALTTVLVSPRFIFLVEPNSSTTDGALSDFELASRLSYFLWSTMPDAELLAVASAGTLRSELDAQVRRMLHDKKSQAFVENFVGQWLHLRNLETVSPDQVLFPEFNAALKDDMRRETELLFAYVLRENLGVLELLDAPYSFLNSNLARHYDLDIKANDKFELVQFSDSKRGGLLTQASILTLTSNPNRTSPVKRGQWIMQQILGTPPPPPPGDVALLDESPQAAQSASLRDRLEAHRSKPECISCHRQMDPLGFALENFDAIGRWREHDGDFEVEAQGELAGNRRFTDISELKRILADTEARRFSWCLIENVLTYGLGRGLVPSDYQLVEQIRLRLGKHDFKFQEIVLGVVESRLFQSK
ncbi:MAG: DUF1592 domain-containing protein [Planctomycetales bacterium]|nr:DUF1592 domain-containing protein [Planctomycetales bacterium]